MAANDTSATPLFSAGSQTEVVKAISSPKLTSNTSITFDKESHWSARGVKESPFPRTQLLVLCSLMMAEGIVYSQALPYIPFMIEHLTGETNTAGTSVATYAGFLAGVFSFGQFLTAHFWGYLSDRIGRKPVILIGAFANVLTIPLFGFSATLPMAFLFRGLNGAMNGNQAVVRSFAAEILTKEHQLRGFSYLGGTYIIGLILGPLLGGSLYDTVSSGVLSPYPAGFSCLVMAALISPTFFAAFTLKETPKRRLNLRLPSSSVNSSQSVSTFSSEGDPSTPPLHLLWGNRHFWLVAAMYSISSFISISLWTVFPLWASVSPDDAPGSWGFGSDLIGYIQAAGGVGDILTAFLIFAPLTGKFGMLRTYRVAWLFPLVGLLLWQLMATLEDDVTRIVAMIAMQTAFAMCFALSFTTAFILNANVVVQEVLGTATGVVQALGCLARTLGPVLCGWLFGWRLDMELTNDQTNGLMGQYFVFYAIAGVAVLNIFCSFGLPSKYNYPRNLKKQADRIGPASS